LRGSQNLSANQFLLPVQRFKRLPRHHHFAAHFEVARSLIFFSAAASTAAESIESFSHSA